MKRVVFCAFTLLWLCLTFTSMGQSLELSDIRLRYVAAVDDETITRQSLELLEKQASLTPVFKGYKGAFEAMLAKHVWNPYKKIAYLKQGKATLAAAIATQPQNLEIRFLRFALQHYLPPFLREDAELEADRLAMVSVLASGPLPDRQLEESVARFLKDSGRCTPEEMELCQQILQNTTAQPQSTRSGK